MLSLRQYRNKKRGLPDYLNYGQPIAPGIVGCKDGSLLVGRHFKGANLSHSRESAWWTASETVSRALGKLGGGWSIWVDNVRLPVSRFTDPARNHFPDPISLMIEQERREAMTREGACFESEYVGTAALHAAVEASPYYRQLAVQQQRRRAIRRDPGADRL